jgi:hypothetical protein
MKVNQSEQRDQIMLIFGVVVTMVLLICIGTSKNNEFAKNNKKNKKNNKNNKRVRNPPVRNPSVRNPPVRNPSVRNPPVNEQPDPPANKQPDPPVNKQPDPPVNNMPVNEQPDIEHMYNLVQLNNQRLHTIENDESVAPFDPSEIQQIQFLLKEIDPTDLNDRIVQLEREDRINDTTVNELTQRTDISINELKQRTDRLYSHLKLNSRGNDDVYHTNR